VETFELLQALGADRLACLFENFLCARVRERIGNE
jgi:hypothetical protein